MWYELEQSYIVIITADADMATIYRTKEEVDEVFVKPIPLDVLGEISRKYLNAEGRTLSSQLKRRP